VCKPLVKIYDPSHAARLGQQALCQLPSDGGAGLFNNLGFVWFKEEAAYKQAMSAREVPVALEHLFRELSFLNIGSTSRVLTVARALQVCS
jgi:hypothetical protein